MNLLNSLRNMVKLAIVTLTGNDSGTYNQTQVSYFGKVKNVLVVNPYGVDANVPKDSLMILFNIMGQEENTAGIGFAPNIRFKNLKEGEVVVGNPKSLSKIYFKKNGDIEIESRGDINITSSGVVNINGSSEAIIKGDAFKTLYNAHTHTCAGAGSPSSAPVVSMGSGQLSNKNFTG